MAQALEEGYSIERIYELTKIDPWFIGKLKNIVDMKNTLEGYDALENVSPELLREAKRWASRTSRLPASCSSNTGTNMEKENLQRTIITIIRMRSGTGSKARR